MRKAAVIMSVICLMLIAVSAHAQSKAGADYFAGKWDLMIKGTPDGDTRLFFVLDKGDSTLSGIVLDSTGKEEAKIDKIELADSTATVYFSARGYDLNLVMNKKDADNITGTLVEMFVVEGIRVKLVK